MTFTRLLRAGLPAFLAAGIVAVASAQSINLNFSSSVTFPTFPPYPYTSPYVQCVEPAERQREDSLVQLQRVYEQEKVVLVQRRGESRIQAWMIPERSDRSDAIRSAERAYRDALRELDRWFRDQEKAIRRQFNDAEDICDDQFDTDVNSPDENNSSVSSSRSSSSRSSSSSFGTGPVCGNGICEVNEGVICPPCDAFPCTQSCMIGTCPQDCGFSTSSSSSRSSSSSSRSSSSSSRSSSSSVFVSCQQGDACVPVSTCNAMGGTFVSPGACGNQSQMQSGYYCCRPRSSSSSTWSSSWSSWIFYPNEDQPAQAQIQSCGCETICDASGTSCMAVCPSEC